MIQTRLSLLRNKFFFLLGIVIFLSIFFLALNTFQSNETELLQKIEKLELQNEAYNKQLEVDNVEQHQRLSAERDLYERTKKELNQKIREQKEIHDKENQDASLRFNSLQQQYKILKTENSDLQQHCEKIKKELATDNDGLKSRLGKLQGQLTKSQSVKENDLTMWKVKYESLVSEKEKLDNLLKVKTPSDEHQELLQHKYKTYQLEQENKELRQKLHLDAREEHQQAPDPPKAIDKSFREQIPVSDDHYKIPIAIRNRMVGASGGNSGYLKSVANFQMNQNNEQSQNVLQQPVAMNGKSSTTTTTPTSVVKKENLVTPAKAQSTSTRTSARPKPLPKGVLPIPELKSDNAEASKNHPNEELKASLDETLGKPQNIEIDESENGAHEVINDNDFNIEEKNSRNNNIEDAFDTDADKNIVNNAAEEFDGHKPLDKKSLRNDEMDSEIINRPGPGVKDKLNDEIAGDHGKEPDGYPEMEDLHMIEGQNEENDDLGDVGEYDDPRKQGGVAERN